MTLRALTIQRKINREYDDMTTTNQKGKLTWSVDQSSKRVLAGTTPPEVQTKIDAVRSSALPKALKSQLIDALQASAAGGSPVTLARKVGKDTDGRAVKSLIEISGGHLPPSGGWGALTMRESDLRLVCKNATSILAYLDSAE